MKPKVNSGATVISFYYFFFFLHHLYADWRHFSASVNGERTNDTSGALGKNSHLRKNTDVTETNCCGFSAHANSSQHPSFSVSSQNGINQNSSTEVHDGVHKLGCTLVFGYFLLTTNPPTWWESTAMVISAMSSISTKIVISSIFCMFFLFNYHCFYLHQVFNFLHRNTEWLGSGEALKII